MHRRIAGLLCGLVACSISTAALAKKPAHYLLFRTTGPTEQAKLKESFDTLLFGELERRGAAVSQTETTCESPDCVALAAKNFEGGATYGVLVRMVPVGERFKFQISLVDIKKAKTVFSTATRNITGDELDVAAASAATSVITKRAASRSTGGGEGGKDAADDRHAALLVGVNAGAIFPFNGVNAKNVSGLFETALLMEIDPIGIEVSGGYRFNKTGSSKADIGTLDFGVRYYLFGEQFLVPYVSGMLGARYQDVAATVNTTNWGLALGAGAGVSLLRHEKFEVPVSVRYEHAIYKGVADEDQVLGTLGIFVYY